MQSTSTKGLPVEQRCLHVLDTTWLGHTAQWCHDTHNNEVKKEIDKKLSEL